MLFATRTLGWQLDLPRTCLDVPEETLQAYAGLYLEQEVQAEGIVRDVGTLAHFLKAVSFSHGAQRNDASAARECEVRRRTAAGYVAILEDLLLAFRLPVSRQRAHRKTVAHEKPYLFDAGVFSSTPPDRATGQPGRNGGACS